ncbi:MAG: cytochrome c oxidase assembly protein, partial [Chloroflexota bacterium]|nr:cytochrome c oxidase assembly protein [Chloroflexota bacterium]
PALTWALAVGTLGIWHLPPLFAVTLADERVHILEHLLFLGTATAFWWPVLAPPDSGLRLAPWAAVVYLAAAMFANAALGIFITFAPPGLYPFYTHPPDVYGILPLIRTGWGLTAARDQQIAGLLMWIPGNLAYLGGAGATLAAWYSAPDTDPAPTPLWEEAV